ncbi:PAQR family membrane homeostasis protein TrhA [Clostridium fallax]|uniref:Hemolysin III n=1 Tax=Clostridium fallax TaxID=1533 RepID=A0A1M4Y343_9CLOT|nr:hemolysin III family protein [Clostridium fallax]SHF00244.1 hemolysin III [Clostridium fallax]SQB07801.1 hemolysin III [Clostridium fallax]
MRDIDFYTRGEEIANAITHGIGALLAIAGAVILIVFASFSGNPYKIVSFTIYGITLIILYLGSTLYHSITNQRAKKVFRVIDHSSIYLLIAGTYTPFALTVLRATVGWWIFGIVWVISIIGITLKAICLEKFDKIATVFYLIMGWGIVFVMKDLIATVDIKGIILLVCGGLAYSFGCIFYAVDKWRYNHAVWHIFVIMGSVLHYFAILLYL